MAPAFTRASRRSDSAFLGRPHHVEREGRLLLARASNDEQASRVGNQTGGRVFLFLNTDDFWRDYKDLVAKGVVFVRGPTEEPFGTVAVFKDLYGNLWDLVQHRAAAG